MKKLYFIILFAGACFSIAGKINAQEKLVNIFLIDKTLNSPIVGANFSYEGQFGISDSYGKISFRLIDRGLLKLSHVQYGNWILDEEAVQDAVRKGKIFRDQEVLTLQPVTVIALHPHSNEKQSVDLDYSDKLSHDGGAVLNQIASISSIKKSGSYGFDPVMRGFKYEQLNIVIDGVQCAVAACPNRMDPPTSQVAPNMMEKVEIFKGPHSLRYGSAFGGTINFVSAPPRFSDVNQPYGRFSGSSESNGEILRTEGLVGISGEKYDFAILGSFSKGNDYKDGEGRKIPAKFQRGSIGFNFGTKIFEDHEIRFSATNNFAKNTDFPSLPMDLISDNTTLLNLMHNVNISGSKLKNWKTSFYGTYVDHKMNNYLKKLEPRTVNAKTDANTLSFGGRSEGSWLFENSRLYAGIDHKVEKAEGTRFREFLMGPNLGKVVKDNVWNGGQISKTGMFTEYHYSFSGYRVIFSGRVEYNAAKATDLNPIFESKNNEVKNNSFNPSFSIGGMLDIADNTSAGLYFGRAQRSGSLTERFINSFPVGLDPYDMLGNPALNPEVNNQIDLILNYNAVSTSFDISVFASILRDYISAEIDPSLSPTMPSSPGVRRFTNIDNAFMTGFEVNWNQRLFLQLFQRMNIAYTYGVDNDRDEPLPEIAPLDFRYILSGNYLENKIQPEISFRYVLKQSRISKTFGESETPQFSLIDLKVGYNFNEIIGFTFGIQNLLDESYYEHLSRAVKGKDFAIFAPGRNLFLSLNVDLM